MNLGWEVTESDLAIVLNAHSVKHTPKKLEKLYSELDFDSIEDGVFNYTSFDNQVSSMLSDIEDQLIETGIVKGAKQFNGPDEDEDDEEDSDEEDSWLDEEHGGES